MISRPGPKKVHTGDRMAMYATSLTASLMNRLSRLASPKRLSILSAYFRAAAASSASVASG
jgi:hypothetical protein